jgi:hypothetical protein
MHVNTEAVLDFIDATISGVERPVSDNHLESCSHCAAELQNWSALVRWITHSHLVSAPEDVLNSGKRVFQVKAPLLRVRSSPRQIVALVTFDSFAESAVVGVRREAATYNQAVSRQVILQAEEFDIYVRVSTFEDHRDLLGQILPRGSRGFISAANLYLRRDDERLRAATVNELGEFQFCDVPEGTLSLQIDLPNVTIISALDATA